MSDFASQKKQACELVKEKPGVYLVVKPARAGSSLNLTGAFVQTKQKAVVVTHSNELAREIKRQVPKVLGYKPKIAIIPDNLKLCRKLNPNLKLKFQLKKSCSQCEYNGSPSHCLYQKILAEDADIYLITYSKLEILQMIDSRLLNIIYGCKGAVLDEVGTRILRSPPMILLSRTENGKTVKASELLQKQFKEQLEEYEKILEKSSYFEKRKDALTAKFWLVMETAVCRIENVTEPGKHQNRIDEAISKSDAKAFWRYITILTEKGKDTTLLQEFYPLMLCEEVFITIKNGNTYATPIEDTLVHLREFCGKFENGLVFLVDAAHPQGLNYDAIFGRKIEPVLWVDPYRTDEQQLILCDRSHWSKQYLLKSKFLQNRLEDTIRSFDFDPEETFIVCLNKEVAKIVEKWTVGDVTWHRSSRTRGLQAEDKTRMFVIIGPYVPMHSFDSLAHSWPDEYFLENFEGCDDKSKNASKSTILRQNYETGEFWNSVARIKDPRGISRSLTVLIGMTKNDVQLLSKQQIAPNWPTISRPKCIQPVAKGGLAKDGPWIARLWFDKADVIVEDLPIVARVIRYARQEKSVSLSQIFVGDKVSVKRTVLKYVDVLKKYDVDVITQSGGLSFEAV